MALEELKGKQKIFFFTLKEIITLILSLCVLITNRQLPSLCSPTPGAGPPLMNWALFPWGCGGHRAGEDAEDGRPQALGLVDGTLI